jgi:hypothetical protein
MMSIRQQRNLLLLMLLAMIGLLPTIPLLQRSFTPQDSPAAPISHSATHNLEHAPRLEGRGEAKQYYKPYLTAVDVLEEDPEDVPPLVRAWRRAKLDFHDIQYAVLVPFH